LIAGFSPFYITLQLIIIRLKLLLCLFLLI
jgi:hypothetical protein